MTAELSSLERVLRRDRQIVFAVLVAVAVFAWIYTIAGVGLGMNALEMSSMESAASNGKSATVPMSGLTYPFALLAMWWMMMIAMMLPSASPTILLTAALNRRSTSTSPPYGTASFFTLGYLLAWLFFSLIAVIAQLLLEHNGLLSTMMHSNSSYLTAGLLITAGVWQFSPIKQACLRHCRSPVDFVTRHRRPGNRGALVMGLHHGSYCLGCCWFLMTLLFVGGVMNLYWIVGLAAFVLIEKLFSRGIWFGRIAGAGCIIAAAAVLVF